MGLEPETVEGLADEGANNPEDLPEFKTSHIEVITANLRKQQERRVAYHNPNKVLNGNTVLKHGLACGVKSQQRLTMASELMEFDEKVNYARADDNVR